MAENAKILALLCGDGRTRLGLPLGRLDYPSTFGITAEISQIATVAPTALVMRKILNREGIRQILAVLHLHNLEGCGGLKGKRLIENREQLTPDALHRWIDNRIVSADPYVHASTILFELRAAAPEGEIVLMVLDHGTMELSPIGIVSPRLNQFPRVVENGFGALNRHLLPAWAEMILLGNDLAKVQAAKVATSNNFGSGQSFNRILANYTTLSPETVTEAQREMGLSSSHPEADPYFAISILPGQEKEGFDQLTYGWQHAAPGAQFVFMGTQAQLDRHLPDLLERPLLQHYIKAVGAELVRIVV